MAGIDPALSISGVRLAVADLPRSTEFYERALGLPVLSRSDERAELGAGRPALVLEQLPAPTRLPPAATGLFHVAWLHPSRAALAETVRRVAASGWPFEGASDHGVSEALYLSDPDGLGIEIYADRPRERWPHPDGGRGIAMYTAPLDLEDLLAAGPAEAGEQIAAGTSVGHVHMKVSDVDRAARFYANALGFEEMARMPSAAFLAAGGYHHHVGLNSWQSAGARPAPDSAPGMRLVEFSLPAPAAIDALAHRFGDSADGEAPAPGTDGTLELRDPDGQLLRFAA